MSGLTPQFDAKLTSATQIEPPVRQAASAASAALVSWPGREARGRGGLGWPPEIAMTQSISKIDACMLDTNVFNHVADGNIPIDAFEDLRLFATHVQLDELGAAKDPERAAALLKVFERIEPKVVVTSSAVWDVSGWDQASWSGEDGAFRAILKRLRELDAENGKTHRDPHNPVRDALIAETAIKNKLTLVSGDQNLRRVVEEFEGHALDLKAVLGRGGQDDDAA